MNDAELDIEFKDESGKTNFGTKFKGKRCKKGFSKSSRNFYIQLYKLSIEYPKVKSISLDYGRIKSKLGVLTKYISQDKNYWK